MDINSKTIIRAGAMAGAMAAVGGCLWSGLTWATPYLQTKPPFAEKQAFDQLAQNFTQQFQAMQQQNAQMQQNQAFLAMGFWTNQKIAAEQELRIHPGNMMAAQQRDNAIQQLTLIQRQLYGK